MHLIGRPTSQPLTQKLAKEFAAMPACPHDRPLSPRRMESHRYAARTGTFRPDVSWSIAVLNGKEYRVNGKHTSNLFATEWDLIKDQKVIVTIYKYHCATYEEMADLYSTFDSRVSGRTTGDINQVFIHDDKIQPRIVNLAVSGLCLAGALYDDHIPKQTPAERAKALLEHPDFLAFVADILQGQPNSRPLRRAGVTAAMFHTFQKSKRDSKEFWILVREARGEEACLPNRKLRDFLCATTGESGGTHTTKSDGSYAMAGKCLQAWNAWRRGKTSLTKFQSGIPRAV